MNTILNLKRYPSDDPDIPAMFEACDRMKQLLKGPLTDEDLMTAAEELVEFQQEDGSFCMLDSLRGVPGDAREDFYYMPTYLAASILSLVFLVKKGRPDDAVKAALPRALNACLGTNFRGHGYGAEAGHLRAMEAFMYGHMDDLMKEHPELSPAFHEAFLKNQNTKVFVYGTLVHDGPNHFHIAHCEYLGNTEADGYALRDLGYFPGAVRNSDSSIQGEVYSVDIYTLRNLDRLEGEGSLYLRRIHDLGWGDAVWIYEFNEPVSGRRRVPEEGRSGEKK